MPVSTTFNGIQTQYPKSGRPATIHLVDGPSSTPPPSTYQLQTKPWSPYFKTHEDFMISEVILDGPEHLGMSIYEAIPLFNAQNVPLQSQIPTSGNPLCFILNPAKTQLSSFRMAQGYPVVVHCANLLTSIQNGKGFGGGHVVGWLPIVKEDPKETKKPEFIAHKCTVWHQAFSMIVQSIIMLSKSGCWLECGDGVKQWLFPTVLMLSGDYKEQTATETHKLVTKAQNTTCAQDHEVLLSTQGVHNVNNVFWNLPLMDPHCTHSFDRLHSNNSSLFGYHFWGMFKTLIEGYGCQQVAQLDTQFHAVPRWSGLTHFQEVMNVSFTNGLKYEDISKILVFITHNIIPWSDKKGWALLRTLRSFSITFGSLMQEYIDASMLEATEDDPAKKWNFPKMHMLVQSFDNIEVKGASCNYNTKPNEKMHRPLKKSYNLQTNFKNIAPQILQIEHVTFMSVLIHSQIDEIDKLNTNALTPDEESPTHLDLLPASLSTAQGRGLWGSFHICLAKWLTAELEASNEGGKEMSYAIELNPSDNITAEAAEADVSTVPGDTRMCSPKTRYEEVLEWRHSLVVADGREERPLDSKDKTLVLQERQAAKYIIRQPPYNISHPSPLDFDKSRDYLIMDVIDHTGDLFLSDVSKHLQYDFFFCFSFNVIAPLTSNTPYMQEPEILCAACNIAQTFTCPHTELGSARQLREKEEVIPPKDLIKKHAGGAQCSGWDNLLGIIPGRSCVPVLLKPKCEEVLMDFGFPKDAQSSLGTGTTIVMGKSVVAIISQFSQATQTISGNAIIFLILWSRDHNCQPSLPLLPWSLWTPYGSSNAL
ncbi:hypothetical protein EI94DRAFT_1703632 [Lactarius quietus]|nr:hypothetical protein EI94DRAFT_1703632 [Lactarius quietus]